MSYLIKQKNGNKVIAQLKVNEKGIRKALESAYPFDALKQIEGFHKLVEGVSVSFKYKGFNWTICKIYTPVTH